ncbi:ShlB/FhaC/HecB family hemolysin secretion/activation protein [Marinomonas posidonica]|uniref:Polypeptide-transport-associated domain protein ShlB-type n=1 Tax=Marinomonas posidonica (strain CECT 7376 / NCIMB 14433 / IVIA-Po-181) TaxID=491952 RepID=F6D151_MARPP|nr:ShlB/FhaC/HecB family hemolysin secretion/activation protein [Marinomonas posidonica]AEF54858.1 Polypeptide-transport-associated domain protein ShlB-type [Marinomonas posidonica IVIA-Po-181]
MQKRTFITGLTALYFVCLSNLSLSAQEESLRNQTDWRLRDKATEEAFDKSLKEATPPIQLPQVQSLPQPTEEEVCFVIDHLNIDGLLSDWALAQGEQYLGECVGFQTLKAYVRLINQKLLAEGYVTSRAVLPEQNIASHTVSVTIQEGVVERIVFPENYRFFWQNALPIEEGKVLNLRDMEQAVEQLSRLQSQEVEFKIQPGTYPNASILVAELKQTKPWSMNASVDDSGSVSTGRYPLSINTTIDNFIGAQDAFTVSMSAAKEGAMGESNSQSFSWTVPLGYGLFGYSNSRSDYRQITEGSVRSFELSGNSRDDKLSLDYVVLRNNKVKLTLNSALKTRLRRSYIEDAEIEAQRRNLTELSLGLGYRHFIGRNVFDFSLDVHQGIEDWLGADKLDPDGDEETAQPDYRFYSLSVSLSSPFTVFGQSMSYTGRLFAQYADTAIYSLDWFSNGGRYTVRGFDSDESLSAEHGWRLKNDVTLPLKIMESSFSPYLGLDVGQVSGDGAEEETSRTLMGLTFGLKGQAMGMNYDLSVSEPFIEYGPYAKAHDYKVSAMLSAQF